MSIIELGPKYAAERGSSAPSSCYCKVPTCTRQAVEAELLQQIRTLYDQIDPVPLEERAIDIASDLFSSCPDLAINLVERATWTEEGENALDSAYARLSIAALGARNGTSEPHDAI